MLTHKRALHKFTETMYKDFLQSTNLTNHHKTFTKQYQTFFKKKLRNTFTHCTHIHVLQNFTHHYQTPQIFATRCTSLTNKKLYTTRQHLTTLDDIINNTPLYTTLTKQQLHKTEHNFTKLYIILQNFTKCYTTLQNGTQPYGTSQK